MSPAAGDLLTAGTSAGSPPPWTSTPGSSTIFVWIDGAPGGAGFAERGADDADAWLRATADMISECGCEADAPCVVSPKRGNGNEPLSKREAERLLGLAHP